MKAVPVSVFAVALLAAAALAGAETPSLRSDNPMLTRMVTRGLSGSETFRRLYQTLESSNLIVHLRLAPLVREGSGFNQFVGQAGAYRYMRITLNVAEGTNEAVALLAHEMQHAVELAEAPSVGDSGDYERLYERIGYQSCQRAAPRCYETDAAVAAGRHVLRELRRKPVGVGAAVAAAHVLARWMAQVSGGWAAEADETP